MPRIVPNGGKGIGCEPRGSHFPFVLPSADVQGWLADLWLAHEVAEAVLPLHVAWISGLDKAYLEDEESDDSLHDSLSTSGDPALVHAVDLVIRDATGLIVFDSTTADHYAQEDVSPRLRHHLWQTDSAVCTIVQHSAFDAPESLRELPGSLTPENGVLDARTHVLVPARLQGIVVGLDTFAGDVILEAGYNMEITQLDDVVEGLIRWHVLQFNCIPGSGAGRFNDCEARDVPIRTINRVGPDSRGRFFLQGVECYSVYRPTIRVADGEGSVVIPYALQLRNDCTTCCTCDDYVVTYTGLVRLRNKLESLAISIDDSRLQHNANALRWNEAIACREEQRITVGAIPLSTLQAEVGVSICNESSVSCQIDLELVLTITVEANPVDSSSSAGGDEPLTFAVAPDTTFKTNIAGDFEPYELAGSPDGPEFTAWWDTLNPGGNAQLRFRLDYSEPPQGSTTIVATLYANGALYAETQHVFTFEPSE